MPNDKSSQPCGCDEGAKWTCEVHQVKHNDYSTPALIPAFTIKDSGQRASFESGMVRDTTEGKIEWHRVSDGPMLKRWAVHLTKGKQKYNDVKPGVPNWTLASGDEEKQRFRQSAYRHFMQWYNGDQDEDHAAATYFNINGYEYTKEKTQ